MSLETLHNLYDPSYEHDACGIGFIAHTNGKKTHQIIVDGITMLNNLEHRGAIGGDKKSGDGAGMLLQIPDDFFRKMLTETLSEPLPPLGEYGCGIAFLPQDEGLCLQAKKMMEQAVADKGGCLHAWRKVPVDPTVLGDKAREVMPQLYQIFVSFDGTGKRLSGDSLEQELYFLRKQWEREACSLGWSIEDFYVCSLSSRSIVYKGMFVSLQFQQFYQDLQDEDFASGFIIVHQRYSTNTMPAWPLAQPFRHIAHNGEINTIKRNRNAMKARESTLESELFGERMVESLPVLQEGGSDSLSFDNVFELLHRSGRSLEHSMAMMVPEAYSSSFLMSEARRAFYDYNATTMEPWDGPAALIFTDGERIGATLDRNGLRPGRFTLTHSGYFILSSEAGALPVEPQNIKETGRLSGGKMIVLDWKNQRLIKNREIKTVISRGKPYRRWIEEHAFGLYDSLGSHQQLNESPANIAEALRVFDYSYEDVRKIIVPMIENGQEPIGSMGNDTPPAVLSQQPRSLFWYFKQLFAQVTNPPIDPYRENLVMSLMTFVGQERNLLSESPEHCQQLRLKQPVLTNRDISLLLENGHARLRTKKLSTVFKAGKGELEKSLHHLHAEALKSIDEGCSILILSDRGFDADNAPMPILLAVSSLHQKLVQKEKRHLVALMVESGEVRDVHHFATLIGYGASAVNPYLVIEAIPKWLEDGYLNSKLSSAQCVNQYVEAVQKGILKIISKMGVSTLRSYKGSQNFEILGLNQRLVDEHFAGSISRIGGIGLNELEEDALIKHRQAYSAMTPLKNTLKIGGDLSSISHHTPHSFSAKAVVLLQQAVRSNDYDLYKKYSAEVQDHEKGFKSLRSLLRLDVTPENSIALDEVEPAQSIVRRFSTAAMSLGSLSPEAHETLAIAMNQIGGTSNSGEGGESLERILSAGKTLDRNSKVKQIASGRFGVNGVYIASAKELQIKVAQGAKPGEGGQLPGNKVNQMVAHLRNSTPGLMLISPPPHHDIYSIEDLAQLIFDLKSANPHAQVSVKLVSEAGVGTVATGVAKAKADAVVISGGDGGTGASPLSSINYAGSSWELGLAEAQQTLIRGGLRQNIRIQVDGQLKTGRDIVIAGLLGGDEFGFATTALVSMGCLMLRKCHTDTCPVGIATQNAALREKFIGKPEHVINFMYFLAEETREYMAALGFRTFDELIGQVEKIKERHFSDAANPSHRLGLLDFSRILAPPESQQRRCTRTEKEPISIVIPESDLETILIAKSQPALEEQQAVVFDQAICNKNRSVGATLSYHVTQKYGGAGLPEDTISVNFQGSAGQSVGAFLAKGITFSIFGEVNDYLGKSLSGGKIIVQPHLDSSITGFRNIVAGNVALFGATAGQAYINGIAGERFAVRNSGAVSVVEGVGDHCCEYMTGGRVVVLGRTGVNFASGMSGGIAYVYDEDQLFDTRCNFELVEIQSVNQGPDSDELHALITKHTHYTNSKVGKRILEDWQETLAFFVKVIPVEYQKHLERKEQQKNIHVDEVQLTEEVYQ